ncbi:MAG: hypothetical protein DKT66_01095 [Candidatus Melainabacteria bacterium]|nr:MAG: hypothetical protein DKT66_01095 [Candidatus Melainabacteria bacterium]
MNFSNDELSDGITLITNVSRRTYDEDFSDLLQRVKAEDAVLDEVAVVFDAVQEEQSGCLPPVQSKHLEDSAIGASGRKSKSWFFYIGRSLCKYLQQDPELSKRIDDVSESTKQTGQKLTAASFTQGVAVTGLASYLSQHVPGFSDLGPAGVAGILLVIQAVGTDAICCWVSDQVREVNGDTDTD